MAKVSYQKLMACDCRSNCPFLFPSSYMETYATEEHRFVFIKLSALNYNVNSFKLILTEIDSSSNAISSRIIASHGLTIKANKNLVINTPIPLSSNCASLFIIISHVTTSSTEWDYEEEMAKKRQATEAAASKANPAPEEKVEPLVSNSGEIVTQEKTDSHNDSSLSPRPESVKEETPKVTSAKKKRHRSIILPNHFSRIVLASSIVLLALVSLAGASSSSGSFPADGTLDANYNYSLDNSYSYSSYIEQKGVTYGLTKVNGESVYLVKDYDISNGTTIVIPNYIDSYVVRGVAPRAFKNKAIKAFSFYSENMIIGDEAFMNSSISLFNIINATSFYLTSVGTRAFANCDNLTSFSCISISTLGDRAFEACDKLASFNLSSSTAKTMSYVGSPFYNCPKLTTYNAKAIRIKPSSSSITPLFQDCKKLATIMMSAPNNVSFSSYNFSQWLYKGTSSNGLALTINNIGTNLGSIMLEGANLRSLALNGSFAIIPANFLSSQNNLTSLSLSSSRTAAVSKGAVTNCDKLSSFESTNTTSVSSGAFTGCHSLRKALLSKNSSTGSSAFPTWTRVYYPSDSLDHGYGYYYSGDKSVDFGIIKMDVIQKPNCINEGYVSGYSFNNNSTYIQTKIPTSLHTFESDYDKCLVCQQKISDINAPSFSLIYQNKDFVNSTLNTSYFKLSDSGTNYDSLYIRSTNNEELSVGFFANFADPNQGYTFSITGSNSYATTVQYDSYFNLTVNPGSTLAISVRNQKAGITISSLSIH